MSSSGGQLGQRGRVDDRGPHLGQLPFWHVGVGPVEVVGDDQPEDGVPEELEPLVRAGAGVLGAPGPVGERPGEQVRVADGPPRRPASSRAGEGSGMGRSGSVGLLAVGSGRYSAEGRSGRAQLCHHVVDRVANSLQVLEILVVDAKSDRSLGQLLLERLHQLDEGQGVGTQVVAEGRPLRDRIGADLQDVGQASPDELERPAGGRAGCVRRGSRRARSVSSDC